MNTYSTIQLSHREITYWKTGHGRQTMLLLHTLRTQIEYAERIVPLLSDQFQIIVPDLPGFGRSSKALGQPYTAELFVEAIREFILKLNLTDIVIVGESIGATIGLCLASRMPERIQKVFAFNPHDSQGALIGGPVGKVVSFVGKFTEEPFKRDIPPLFKFILQAGFANKKNLSDDFVGKLLSIPTKDPKFPHVMKSLMKEAPSWSTIADTDYPKIPGQIKTRVIYGEQDWSPAYAQKQNQHRLPKHVHFESMKNTGHFSFLDNPSLAANIILMN